MYSSNSGRTPSWANYYTLSDYWWIKPCIVFLTHGTSSERSLVGLRVRHDIEIPTSTYGGHEVPNYTQTTFADVFWSLKFSKSNSTANDQSSWAKFIKKSFEPCLAKDEVQVSNVHLPRNSHKPNHIYARKQVYKKPLKLSKASHLLSVQQHNTILSSLLLKLQS